LIDRVERGIVSSQVLRGRAGRARWALASVAAAALVLGVSACSGDDDDDDATADSAQDTAVAAAQDDVAAAEASLDDANATIADQESQISDLNDQVDTATQAASDAEAKTASETQRADKAESDLADLQGQVDAVAANFPVTVPASLEPYTESLVGGYTMSLTEAFCGGLPTCGQPRPDVHADIIQGPNGLELQVPNVFTTGLFMVNGSLFGVTDSDQIVGACADGTATNSQVSTTIFADGITVEVDGTESLSGLGASVFVAVNPAGSCGAGNIFFAATLTPD
jgi:hypothetical protein